MNGNGTKQNYEEAYKWNLKVAERGNQFAQTVIGAFYADGLVVEKNDKQAFEWYLKAAEQGYADAQNEVGVRYRNGKGVEQDNGKAFEWYQKASDNGLAVAQYNLGSCYELGIGTDADEKQAFEWYLKAAEQGDADAQCKIGLCYFDGIGTSVNKKKAFNWFRKSADQDDILAETFLGILYLDKELNEKEDFQDSFIWIKKAADKGFSFAQASMACFYLDPSTGIGVDKSIALEWMKKALKNENPYVDFIIGYIYFKYLQDNEKAKEYFEKSQEEYKSEAWNRLAIIYLGFVGKEDNSGKENSTEEDKALEYVNKSSKENDPIGLFLFSYIYRNGKCGCEKNIKLSREYAQKAVKAGLEEAIDDINDFNCLISDNHKYSDVEFILAKYALKRGIENCLVLNAVLGTYSLNLQRIIEKQKGEDYTMESISMPELVWKKLSAWNPESVSFPTYLSTNIKHPNWQKLDRERYKNAQTVINYVIREGFEIDLLKDLKYWRADKEESLRFNTNLLKDKKISVSTIRKVFPELDETSVVLIDSRIQELLCKTNQSRLYYTDEEGDDKDYEIEDESSNSVEEIVVLNDKKVIEEKHQSHFKVIRDFIIGFDGFVSGQTNKEIASLYVARIMLYPLELNDSNDKRAISASFRKTRDLVGRAICEIFDDISLQEVKEILSQTKHFCMDINWYYSERISNQPLIHSSLQKGDIRNHLDFSDKYLYQHLGMSNGASFSRTCGTLDKKLDEYYTNNGIFKD